MKRYLALLRGVNVGGKNALPMAELEREQGYKNLVFWSFSRRDYQKTNWWSKTAGSEIKDKITIRTAGTVRKLVKL